MGRSTRLPPPSLAGKGAGVVLAYLNNRFGSQREIAGT